MKRHEIANLVRQHLQPKSDGGAASAVTFARTGDRPGPDHPSAPPEPRARFCVSTVLADEEVDCAIECQIDRRGDLHIGVEVLGFPGWHLSREDHMRVWREACQRGRLVSA